MKLNALVTVLAALLIATMIEANDVPDGSTNGATRAFKSKSKSGTKGKVFELVLGEGSGDTISIGGTGGLGEHIIWTNPFVETDGWVNRSCHRVLPREAWPTELYDYLCTYQYGFGERGSIFAMGNSGTGGETTWNAIVGGTGAFAGAVGTIGITWVADGDDVGFWKHELIFPLLVGN